jgi:hypothetical protein
MKVPKDVADALKQWKADGSPPIIRRRCVADVYNNEDEIKHRCQRMAKEDSRHCWQHEPRGYRGLQRKRA